MSAYELHHLGWYNFQQLCLTIAREVLGQTVQSFLNSKDGGRDGAFTGVWKQTDGDTLQGRFVIQCKFTSRKDRGLTISDISDELKKARRLVECDKCDCYLLLTNFDVSGTRDEQLEAVFLEAGVKQFRSFGSDWICQQIREHSRLRMLVPRVYGLGDLSQILDERAYRQARALLESMREDLSRVVLTNVYQRAVTALEDEGFVLLLGEPACGKTTIAAMLAMAAIDQWHVSTMKLEMSQQMVERWNPEEPKQFFWIDDAFGVTQYESSLALEWNRIFPKARAMLSAGARIVLTSRDYIYRRAKKDLKESAFPLMRESQVVVDVRDITAQERKQILYNHIKLGNQPLAFRIRVKPFLEQVAAHPRFSPEIARRLGNSTFTNALQLCEHGISDFVERHEQLLKEIISGLDQHSQAALALIFMRNDGLQSPVALRESEGSALIRLGSTLGETITALTALQDSLTVYVRDGDQPLWKFKHPTIGDAYGTIVLENPELMDIYIQGASTEKLLDTITCGNVGLQGAVIVPRDLFHLVIEKLAFFAREQQDQASLEQRFRRRQIDRFLATRCDREFLRRFVELYPDVCRRLSLPGRYLWARPEVDLALKLIELELLPEQDRRVFVNRIAQYTVDGEDSYYFESARIRNVFTPNEKKDLDHRLKTMLVPNLTDVRHFWESNLPDDEDPESYIEPYFEILSGIQTQLEPDEAIDKIVERERELALSWVSETKERLDEALDRSDLEGDDDLSSDYSAHSHSGERSVFDDVDT